MSIPHTQSLGVEQTPEMSRALLQAVAGDKPQQEGLADSPDLMDVLPFEKAPLAAWKGLAALKALKAAPLVLGAMKSPRMEERLGKEFWKNSWKTLREFVAPRDAQIGKEFYDAYAGGKPWRYAGSGTQSELPSAALRDQFGATRNSPTLDEITRMWEDRHNLSAPTLDEMYMQKALRDKMRNVG